MPSSQSTGETGRDEARGPAAARGSGFSIGRWCLLAALLLLVPLLYAPLALHNLPVAANVDERTSLSVLARFYHGSLNPKFFMYPTLYYYVTYFFIAPFGFSKALFLGRLLNLSCVGLLAFATYAFCARHLRSKPAGLLAALCVVGSNIVVSSGAYLCTDVLLAATTLGSLHWLTAYFDHAERRAWLVGMVLLGLAVGCKYTAFLLYIAYYLTEVAATIRSGPGPGRASFSRTTVLLVLLVLGVLGLGAAAFFPVGAVLGFVSRNRINADLRDVQDYLHFFQHVRRLLGELGIFFLLLAILARVSTVVNGCLARKRPYAGLAIVVGISYLSTPFSLIDPKRFLYDLGALFRANIVVAASHAQWPEYARWLVSNENGLLLLLSAAGIGILIARTPRHLMLVAIYACLYVLVIGSSHMGFPRYLTPILPLVYCGAGVALCFLWECAPRARIPWARALALLLILAASFGVSRQVISKREQGRTTDSFLASYRVARQNTHGTVFYAGYAPSVELEAEGLQTRQVPWSGLRTGSLGAGLHCGDVLVLDGEGARLHGLRAKADPGVDLLLDDPRDAGQEVLRKSGCR